VLQTDTFWALVGLIVFVIIMFAVGAPKRIVAALDERTIKIRDELEAARRAREEARALLLEYQRKRGDAEREAEKIVEDARAEAERLTAEAKQKLKEMVERRTKVAETKIAQAEAQAIAEVRGRAADLAVLAAGNLLRDKLKGEAGYGLIDTSITTVRTRLN
jgi:F-type H+-transporting ATPase subunit b